MLPLPLSANLVNAKFMVFSSGIMLTLMLSSNSDNDSANFPPCDKMLMIVPYVMELNLIPESEAFWQMSNANEVSDFVIFSFFCPFICVSFIFKHAPNKVFKATVFLCSYSGSNPNSFISSNKVKHSFNEPIFDIALIAIVKDMWFSSTFHTVLIFSKMSNASLYCPIFTKQFIAELQRLLLLNASHSKAFLQKKAAFSYFSFLCKVLKTM
mmetsp:Transcript_7207/g.10747  ORF Transcript_7207/g.10747 Transcript_7207/m.10747 type:complete len:211 (+) Transcript_7207:61-693(+)